MRTLVTFAAGSLFGLGLAVSGMIDPSKVLGFLDVVGGAWDPTLAFVMAGAIAPMTLAWRIAASRGAPALGGTFPQPAVGRVDVRLAAGSALFGAGWGLVGFCPGPALAALTLAGAPAAVFVAAMLAGMAGHAWLDRRA